MMKMMTGSKKKTIVLLLLFVLVLVFVPLVNGAIESLSFSFSTARGTMNIFDSKNGAQKSFEDENHIQIRMEYIYEIGADKTTVYNGGNLASSDFSRVPYTITPLSSSTINNIPAGLLTMTADLFPLGVATFDIYLLQGTGTIDNGGEFFGTNVFDTKFNIGLASWPFCTSTPGPPCDVIGTRDTTHLQPIVAAEESSSGSTITTADATTQGAYIDVAFSLIGKNLRDGLGLHRINLDNPRIEFALGGSITVKLSTRVNVDGVWMDMPDGFPALDQLDDGTPIFVIRLPKFTDTVLYDPLITTSQSGDPTAAPTDSPTMTPDAESTESSSSSSSGGTASLGGDDGSGGDDGDGDGDGNGNGNGNGDDNDDGNDDGNGDGSGGGDGGVSDGSGGGSDGSGVGVGDGSGSGGGVGDGSGGGGNESGGGGGGSDGVDTGGGDGVDNENNASSSSSLFSSFLSQLSMTATTTGMLFVLIVVLF